VLYRCRDAVREILDKTTLDILADDSKDDEDGDTGDDSIAYSI
jgi:hypothetical protein